MKLLIADDHTLFRDAVVQYIQRADSDANVTVTKDFHEAYDIVKQDQDYELVLLDLRMPGMDGLGGLEKMRDEFPDVKFALMSGVAEDADVRAAMALGACGYFPKTMSGKSFISAIQEVLRGDIFMPLDQNSKRVMPSYRDDGRRANFSYGGMAETQSGLAVARYADNDIDQYSLTPREIEVLGYLVSGRSNKEIADALGLQVVTVKLHVRGICRKLAANNRTQAALKAAEMGIAAT